MTPPRVKPCPACGAPCACAATACRSCGHHMPRRANPGPRRAPDAQDRLAAALALRAWQPGQPVPPIVGKRRAAKPEIVLRIAILAKQGKTKREIAEALGRKPSGIGRYAHDYGIRIRPAIREGGGAGEAGRLRMWFTMAECRDLMKTTTNVEAIAEALGIATATARVYMKRCRDLFGIALPEFDRRSRCGKSAK